MIRLTDYRPYSARQRKVIVKLINGETVPAHTVRTAVLLRLHERRIVTADPTTNRLILLPPPVRGQGKVVAHG